MATVDGLQRLCIGQSRLWGRSRLTRRPGATVALLLCRRQRLVCHERINRRLALGCSTLSLSDPSCRHAGLWSSAALRWPRRPSRSSESASPAWPLLWPALLPSEAAPITGSLRWCPCRSPRCCAGSRASVQPHRTRSRRDGFVSDQRDEARRCGSPAPCQVRRSLSFGTPACCRELRSRFSTPASQRGFLQRVTGGIGASADHDHSGVFGAPDQCCGVRLFDAPGCRAHAEGHDRHQIASGISGARDVGTLVDRSARLRQRFGQRSRDDASACHLRHEDGGPTQVALAGLQVDGRSGIDRPLGGLIHRRRLRGRRARGEQQRADADAAGGVRRRHRLVDRP